MADFMISFLISNLWIGIMTAMLLAVQKIFRRCFTNRTKYHLWFLLLGFCMVPLLPLPAMQLPLLKPAAVFQGTAPNAAAARPEGAADWLRDFSITISKRSPLGMWKLLFLLWVTGMAVMAVRVLRHTLRFYQIRQSALPLQNAALRSVYQCCLKEMHMQKQVPVYSTAYLSSPVIAGLFRQRIYLPISVISNFSKQQVRYMLLHELAHYQHKDTLVQVPMKLIRIAYWFHPLVLYALSEMQTDRETACDACVLELLCEEDYKDYGNTLLDLAQNASMPVFPFAAGISGTMIQLKKRVLNIVAFHRPTKRQRIQSRLAFLLTAVMLSGFLPLLSTHAAAGSRYGFKEAGRQVRTVDLSKQFDGYSGSFVLYDTADRTWQIYQKDAALTRIAPASTYKIYSALLALETGAITPWQSTIRWNGQTYGFASWNADQDLTSALKNSVNWYFQALDARIGMPKIQNHIRRIGYGNQCTSRDTSYYWADGTLKISPVEQVELLQKFYYNSFGFAPEHINAVKQAIRLESGHSGTLYGKTGTLGYEDGSISGWLIGFVETGSRTCFFATNIQNDGSANGQTAAQITLNILSEMHIWNNA